MPPVTASTLSAPIKTDRVTYPLSKTYLTGTGIVLYKYSTPLPARYIHIGNDIQIRITHTAWHEMMQLRAGWLYMTLYDRPNLWFVALASGGKDLIFHSKHHDIRIPYQTLKNTFS